MKHLLGLVVAGLFGCAAAGLNWMWMSGLATPKDFVAVASDIDSGETIDEEDLVAVPIPGQAKRLRAAFIPWQNRSVLFGTVANRDYLSGDVVFHRDIQAPVEDSQWDVIGPFKLISVGERFKEISTEDGQYARTDGNNLTIAVDANFDARTKKLLEIIRTDKFSEESRQAAIVAVQVLPSNQRGGRIQRSEPDEVVYQTVSLEGIANVPKVLLEGDMIRFVVPARPQY